MNMSPRVWIPLVVVIMLAAAPLEHAAAQCAVCPTTAVVAYQPVVTPVDPGLINGWYPGKLLDRWAASRAAYRTTAMTAATTVSRPIMTAAPVTSYRPVTSLFSTSYMPVSVYRPALTQPLVATTAYSPITATTAYSPTVTSSAVCCDPCSTGAVVNYATPASACCTPTVGGTSYGGVVTEQPALAADVPIPGSANYPPNPPPRPPQNNSAGATDEDSVLNRDNGNANGPPQPQQNGTSPTGGASFDAPPLYVPGLEEEAEKSQDRTARGPRTEAVAAVYNAPVRPQLVHDSRTKTATSRALPSRAERDAGWTAVSD